MTHIITQKHTREIQIGHRKPSQADVQKTIATLDKGKVKAVENAMFEKIMGNSDVIYRFSNNDDAAFFARQLSTIYPYLLFTKFPNLHYEEYVDIFSGAAYDKYAVTQLYDYTAEALIADQLSTDLPLVGVAGLEQLDQIKDIPIGTFWTWTDWQAAKAEGRVDLAKLKAVKRGTDQKLNNMFLYGDASYNATGLLTNVLIPRYTVAKGASGFTDWSRKTPQEIFEDIHDILVYMSSNSDGVFTCRKLVISLKAFNKAFGRPRSDYVNLSIYNTILENFPELEAIVADPFLNGVGTSGHGDGRDVMVALDKDPENYYMRRPLLMQALPMVQEGVQLTFPFLSRATGLILIQSNSIVIAEGL